MIVTKKQLDILQLYYIEKTLKCSCTLKIKMLFKSFTFANPNCNTYFYYMHSDNKTFDAKGVRTFTYFFSLRGERYVHILVLLLCVWPNVTSNKNVEHCDLVRKKGGSEGREVSMEKMVHSSRGLTLDPSAPTVFFCKHLLCLSCCFGSLSNCTFSPFGSLFERGANTVKFDRVKNGCRFFFLCVWCIFYFSASSKSITRDEKRVCKKTLIKMHDCWNFSKTFKSRNLNLLPLKGLLLLWPLRIK